MENLNVIVLTYLGTVLIAMEFIRKFTALQALMGMLVGWPVASAFGESGVRGWVELFKVHKLSMTIRLLSSFFLCIVILPITVVFYIIWFITLILNTFHNWVNRLYSNGLRKYRHFLLVMIGITLFSQRLSNQRKRAQVDEQKVLEHMGKSDIPILPIIGIILITIAFVMILT